MGQKPLIHFKSQSLKNQLIDVRECSLSESVSRDYLNKIFKNTHRMRRMVKAAKHYKRLSASSYRLFILFKLLRYFKVCSSSKLDAPIPFKTLKYYIIQNKLFITVYLEFSALFLPL